MSSLSQSSLSLPVHDCTATSLDFDLQEKFLLLHTVELNGKSIDTWIQELSESEIQNINLRKKILEREKQIKELSSMLQCEKINIQKGDRLSKSVKEVQAHLQCQIERKEAENDELKVKIQTLENKIAEWKHQIGEYKCQKLALKETREQKKIALKKALRSQKQRAQHLEEAVKDVTSKIREHEVKLCEILSTSDAWKKQHDRLVEEKKMLEVQIKNLENQIRGLMEDMERREEQRRNSEAEILGKLNSVNSENKNLYLENKKLKASLATLEKSTVSVECELLQLQEKAKLQENLLEQRKNEYERRKSYYIPYQRIASTLLQVHIVCTELCEAHLKLIEANNCKLALARFASKKQDLANACEKYMFSQVQKRQIAVEELKSRYVTVLNENRKITENKCLEADKVRNKTEAELKELEHVCDLLKAAEENQQKLLSWERIVAQKCKTLRELELQDNCSVTSVGNLCLEEENCNIQKIYEALQRQLGEVEYQSEELAYQLRKEDEILQSSKLQLEEKIAEYNALTRQLESALEEGRKMVAEEQEKMSYKEQAFQTKLLLLEAEVRKRQEEKKQLLCLFHHNEKHHEVHLKELENSLQKSENKNQSIQNYVQFLKDAYVTMFG